MPERRTQYRVEELGVAELVDELLARGVTYEEIAEAVKTKTGAAVGKSSIARYNRGLQRRLEKIRRMRESADAIAGLVKERGEGGDPDMRLEDLVLAVMANNLLEKGTEDDLDVKEVTFLSSAAAQVAGAKARMEHVRQTERKRFARAWKRATEELRALLKDSGLWDTVQATLAKNDPTAEDAA